MKRLLHSPYDDVLSTVVYPKIVEACKTSAGKFGADDVVKKIKSNEYQLWLAYDDEDLDGIVLTEIVQYPQAKTLRFICLTGIKVDDFSKFMAVIDDWLVFVNQIEEWGKSLGCVLSEIEGPQGWGALMKKYGYKCSHIILNKELT